MNAALYLIPVSLILGLLALAAFFWTLRHRQYDDPEGDASRILGDEHPLSEKEREHLRKL